MSDQAKAPEMGDEEAARDYYPNGSYSGERIRAAYLAGIKRGEEKRQAEVIRVCRHGIPLGPITPCDSCIRDGARHSLNEKYLIETRERLAAAQAEIQLLKPLVEISIKTQSERDRLRGKQAAKTDREIKLDAAARSLLIALKEYEPCVGTLWDNGWDDVEQYRLDLEKILLETK